MTKENMPEDIDVDNEVSELNDGFDDGFEQGDQGETLEQQKSASQDSQDETLKQNEDEKQEQDEDEADADNEGDENNENDEEQEDNSEENKGGEEDDKQTPQQKLQEIVDAEKKGAQSQETPQKQQEEEQPPPPKKTPDNKAPEYLSNIESIINDIPDMEIEVAGENVNLKEHAQSVPEEVAIGALIADGLIKKKMESGELVSADQVNEMQYQLNELLFWNDVTKINPEGREIYASEDFKKYVDKQPEEYQNLIATSPNPAFLCQIFDNFKESQAKENAAKIDKKAGEKKRRKNDLHKETLRSKKTEVNRDGDKDDFDEGFDSYED